MQDQDLKKLLLETCPVRPGQEGRAWAALQERLYRAKPASRWNWLYYPTWRGLALSGAALALIAFAGGYLVGGGESLALATADSQSPGIYATAFYSRTAQAQVVWLNGMEPATDRPTYLDPPTVVSKSKRTPAPTGDPNSL
jgi:hypothetical protein